MKDNEFEIETGPNSAPNEHFSEHTDSPGYSNFSEEESSDFNMTDESGTEVDYIPEDEIVSFSWRQRLLLGAVIFFSFLLFSVFLFPYDHIIRYILTTRVSSPAISYQSLNLSMTGKSEIQALTLRFANGSIFRSTEVGSTVSIFQARRGNFHGVLESTLLEYTGPTFGFRARSGTFDFDLTGVLNSEGPGFLGPVQDWRGTLAIEVMGMDILQLPDNIPIPINLSQLEIQGFSTQAAFTDGDIQVQNARLISNLMEIDLTGSIRPGSDTARSPIDGRMCIVPDSTLQEVSPLIWGYVTMAGSPGERICFLLSGTLGSPDLQPENPDIYVTPGDMEAEDAGRDGNGPDAVNGDSLPESPRDSLE